ncbi:MAG TPA: hypothetical protein PKD26_16800 [Pyrinomonadaceae bacterium]|nr:hypothetical protein [Pyrinomonadaceae bacterium]
MDLKQTKLHILHKPADLASKAKTGVSLHCHTEHSREQLDFLPHYAEKLPIISKLTKRETSNYAKREGRAIDFSTAFWLPPLSSQSVFDIEEKQIHDVGLDALVSLTDHDCIDGNLNLQASGEIAELPISLEWTVPFEFGYFHVGVHNLPKDRAVEITKDLLSYTFGEEGANNAKLHQLFAMLNEIPELLIVLNHPLWDIGRIGTDKNRHLLDLFMNEHGKWIHAFEINGFRKWSENKGVIEIAEAYGIPVVTGGDRHGCQPNTVINLTNAKTFAEFTEEVRVDRRSEVVLMPEYRHNIHSRQMQSFSEILNHYPEFREGHQKWFDRIHFDIGDGHGVRPLSVHWVYGGPTWLRMAIWILGVAGSPKFRPLFRLVMRKVDRVPKNASETMFEIPDLKEIAGRRTEAAAS